MERSRQTASPLFVKPGEEVVPTLAAEGEGAPVPVLGVADSDGVRGDSDLDARSVAGAASRLPPRLRAELHAAILKALHNELKLLRISAKESSRLSAAFTASE
jgi:hypothetical protein